MTNRQAVAVFGLGIAALLWLGDPAAGQQSYRPPSPTFSPWLNLYQRNTGALDNYHTYVRPEFQLRDTLRQQADLNRRQTAGLSRLSDRVGDLQKGETAVRPTGTASVFGNYSHYYPRSASGQGTARLRAPRSR